MSHSGCPEHDSAGSGSRWSVWEAAALGNVANFSKSHIIVGKSCPVLAPYESFQSPLRSPDRASVSLLLPRFRGVGTGSSLDADVLLP